MTDFFNGLGPLAFVIVVLVAIVIGFILGSLYRKKVKEATIGSAEQEAMRIVSDAVKAAEAKRKETLIEAKDEIHQLRLEFDRDNKEQRMELNRQEKRIQGKEENIDRKMDTLEKKDNRLVTKLTEVDAKVLELDSLKQKEMDSLEKISNYSVDQAKQHLLSLLDDELDHEKAARIVNFEERLKDEMDEKARHQIALAITRCAADHASETTVSVVPLPSEEMKGRIIGREGRNIRALETLTGVDLIIDDTPEAITLSSFDPVRREIARIALEKLIIDGRIHPARIEEMVNKAKGEVAGIIKREGERAIIEVGVHGVHPELVRILGRLKYRTSYGQNVLNHSIEVAHLSALMASELGINPNLARRAGLLHDIGKALDHDVEGSHVDIGVDVAKKYKENQAILHAIHAHHGDVEPTSIEACLVMAADAISAARPGARRENIENYIKRLQKLEEIATSFEGVDSSFAIQAGREIRIMVNPENVSDDKMVLIARDIVKKIEEEMDYPGQIKVHLVRESRAVDYAK